ncbi:hypothetical protein GQ457_16G006620 [Hibiscus cannabinus]
MPNPKLKTNLWNNVIFFAHGLEIQLWQSSRPQFDTLSVQEYSEKYADPIALHFVFLVQACLRRDLGSTAPNMALICCSVFLPSADNSAKTQKTTAVSTKIKLNLNN